MTDMRDTFDFTQLVTEAIAEVQPNADVKGVHVAAVNVAAMPRWVEADEAALRRVLLNLLDAVVGSAVGGTVTLRIRRIDDDAHASDRWLCAIAWPGDLDEAISGVHCTFEVELTPSHGMSPDRPLRVLVVDDASTHRALVASYLSGSPHEVVEAASGRQAVESVTAAAFDVVLMDLHMPDMDGLSATRAIRAFEQSAGRARSYVVALSATGEDAAAATAAGADIVINKPIGRTALIRLLAQVPEAPPPPAVASVAAPMLTREPVELMVDTARRRLTAILMSDSGSDEDSRIEQLQALGRGLKSSARDAGLTDIAHLAAALEEAATHASAREAITTARTLQAWMTQMPNWQK